MKINLKNNQTKFGFVLFLILIFTMFVGNTLHVFGQPTGASILYNITDFGPTTPAASITTAGGTFTTMVLNGSFQTQKWKAYVGNVTGIITLDDSTSSTIYDWELAVITGEVYVSRNESVSWSSIGCSQQTTINAEESFLNINASRADSINNTFNDTVHAGFYVGTIQITNSSCRAIATYVNDARQTADENAVFQEILLEDADSKVVYASILENNQAGYNMNPFDFQMIIPEDETKGIPTPYYFYVEIS